MTNVKGYMNESFNEMKLVYFKKKKKTLINFVTSVLRKLYLLLFLKWPMLSLIHDLVITTIPVLLQSSNHSMTLRIIILFKRNAKECV